MNELTYFNRMPLRLVINPLVSAAENLLEWVSILKAKRKLIHSQELFEILNQEIKVFENRALALHYRSQVILAARYLLCALLDEAAQEFLTPKHEVWSARSLIQSFHKKPTVNDHFFQILQRSAEDPTLFKDVLELGYLCLALGYQGKFKNSRNTEDLNLLMDNLYQFIQIYRGEFSKKLFIEKDQKLKSVKRRRKL